MGCSNTKHSKNIINPKNTNNSIKCLFDYIMIGKFNKNYFTHVRHDIINSKYLGIPLIHWIVLCALKYNTDTFTKLIHTFNFIDVDEDIITRGFRFRLVIYDNFTKIIINGLHNGNKHEKYNLVPPIDIVSFAKHLKKQFTDLDTEYITFKNIEKKDKKEKIKHIISNINLFLVRLQLDKQLSYFRSRTDSMTSCRTQSSSSIEIEN